MGRCWGQNWFWKWKICYFVIKILTVYYKMRSEKSSVGPVCLLPIFFWTPLSLSCSSCVGKDYKVLTSPFNNKCIHLSCSSLPLWPPSFSVFGIRDISVLWTWLRCRSCMVGVIGVSISTLPIATFLILSFLVLFNIFLRHRISIASLLLRFVVSVHDSQITAICQSGNKRWSVNSNLSFLWNFFFVQKFSSDGYSIRVDFLMIQSFHLSLLLYFPVLRNCWA